MHTFQDLLSSWSTLRFCLWSIWLVFYSVYSWLIWSHQRQLILGFWEFRIWLATGVFPRDIHIILRILCCRTICYTNSAKQYRLVILILMYSEVIDAGNAWKCHNKTLLNLLHGLLAIPRTTKHVQKKSISSRQHVCLRLTSAEVGAWHIAIHFRNHWFTQQRTSARKPVTFHWLADLSFHLSRDFHTIFFQDQAPMIELSENSPLRAFSISSRIWLVALSLRLHQGNWEKVARIENNIYWMNYISHHYYFIIIIIIALYMIIIYHHWYNINISLALKYLNHGRYGVHPFRPFLGGCLLVLCCGCSNENMIFTTQTCSKKSLCQASKCLGFCCSTPYSLSSGLILGSSTWRCYIQKTGHNKDWKVILKVEEIK